MIVRTTSLLQAVQAVSHARFEWPFQYEIFTDAIALSQTVKAPPDERQIRTVLSALESLHGKIMHSDDGQRFMVRV